LKKSVKNYIIRYVVLVIGLFIMAFGVALSKKANLGTSPISSIPSVLTEVLPFTMGQITTAFNVVLVLIQIALLRRDFPLIQLLQIPVSFLFGYFTDAALSILSGLNPTNYIACWAFCILSFFLVAIGVFLEVKANVVMMAGEGTATAVSKKLKIEFPKAKVAFDVTMVIIAVVISLLCLHGLKGVREGTVAAAICIGMIVKLYNKLFPFVDKLLGN